MEFGCENGSVFLWKSNRPFWQLLAQFFHSNCIQCMYNEILFERSRSVFISDAHNCTGKLNFVNVIVKYFLN